MKKKNENTQENYGFSSAAEAFNYMKEHGYNVEWNDIPIPCYDNQVPAGKPNGVGDVVPNFNLIPKHLFELGAEFTVNVNGESMKDADIETGDMLGIKCCPVPDEGDMVIADLDGELTVKNYHVGENGEKLLVPRNLAFDPIDMKDYINPRIIGRVTTVTKPVRRVSTITLKKYIGKSEDKPLPPPNDNVVRGSINAAMALITKKRQWFSVYRTLADANVIQQGDYTGFVNYINKLFPDNDFGITERSISVMDVGSFTKPVLKWKEETAPVHGKAFGDYMRIAVLMKRCMRR